MQTIKTIGLDIAKSVFQVHGVDATGQVVIRRQLKRRSVLAFFQKLPPCLVGIEACASSHHWSRELKALGHQHQRREPGKPTWRCLNRLSLSSAWLAPLNRGSPNSAHIHGTDVRWRSRPQHQ